MRKCQPGFICVIALHWAVVALAGERTQESGTGGQSEQIQILTESRAGENPPAAGRPSLLAGEGVSRQIPNRTKTTLDPVRSNEAAQWTAPRTAQQPGQRTLTPKLPETGEIGISIQLSRFSLAEDGKLHVTVSFARSGLDGGGFEYVLERTDAGWSIADVIPGGIA